MEKDGKSRDPIGNCVLSAQSEHYWVSVLDALVNGRVFYSELVPPVQVRFTQ